MKTGWVIIIGIATVLRTAAQVHDEEVLDYFFPAGQEMRSVDPEYDTNVNYVMYNDSDSTLVWESYTDGGLEYKTVNRLKITGKEILIENNMEILLMLPDTDVTETWRLEFPDNNYLAFARRVVILLRIDGHIQEKEAIEITIAPQTDELPRTESARQYWVKGIGLALCVCSTCSDEEPDSVSMYMYDVLDTPEYAVKTADSIIE